MLAARHRVFSKVLAARKANLINALARKNKRTARMLANVREDHSIPLTFSAQSLIQKERLRGTCK